MYDENSSRNEELGLKVIPDAALGFHPSEQESLISDVTMSSDAVAHSYGEPETGHKPQNTTTLMCATDKHHHRNELKCDDMNLAGCRTSVTQTHKQPSGNEVEKCEEINFAGSGTAKSFDKQSSTCSNEFESALKCEEMNFAGSGTAMTFDNQSSSNELEFACLSEREDDQDGTEFQEGEPSLDDSMTKQGICTSRSDRKRKLDRSQEIFEHSHQSAEWLLVDEGENSDDDLIYTSLDSVGHQREGLDSSQDGVKKQKIFVMRTNNDKVLGRKYDKVMYCLYCSKPQTRVSRHLKVHHRDQPDVVKYMTAKTQEEENYHLTMMRNKGNHRHNYDVMEKGEGQLVVVYRPNHNADPKDYRPCRYCFGWFARKEAWQHKCVANTEKGEGKSKKGLLWRLLVPSLSSSMRKKLLQTIVDQLKEGQVKECVKNDSLILEFAKLDCKETSSIDVCRNRVRELARLLLEYRRCSNMEDATLMSLLSATELPMVIKAAQVLCGFDRITGQLTIPSLALKLGASLQKAALILLNQAVLLGAGDAKRQEMEEYNTLLENTWEKDISSYARIALQGHPQITDSTPAQLSLSTDVVALSRYLHETAETCLQQLAQDVVDVRRVWDQLSQCTMVHLMIFNGKRQGAVPGMMIDDHGKIRKGELECQTESLNIWEQKLAKVLWRVDLAQEHGETVPVLMTDFDKYCLDALVRYREQIDVSSQNVYLFATSDSLHLDGTRALQVSTSDSLHLDGTRALQDSSVKCRAENPLLLQSVILREEMATMTQVMGLRGSELDVLTQCVGNSITIHPQLHSSPSAASQLVKIANILFQLSEKGDLLDREQTHDDFDLKEFEGTFAL